MSDSGYQVLARKWRPQRFAEVVGQEHITRTLQNAILQGRVGHAYLFVGPRGIGKTTSARIFAKALNCEAGIVAEPCCECQSCREIAAGSSLDVIEIDGASHNRVEHIRDIRDNVQYTPSRSRYKVYIIDEVHMLTSSAWNALLKTLEEPPPHVKFLFATTEPHKVLPTIVSRCQRFDLRRIPTPLIAARLAEIARAEGVGITDAALTAIARAADGGLRDGQSIFDQMIAFCGTGQEADIQERDVIDVFGLASGAELTEVTHALVSDDTGRALSVIQNLADRGRDLERLLADLIQFLRDVLVAQVCRDSSTLSELTGSQQEEVRQLCSVTGPGVTQRLLDSLLTSEAPLRHALNKRVFLEVALIRAMREANSVQLEDVIARLADLRGDSPSLPPAAPGSGDRPAPAPPIPAASPAVEPRVPDHTPATPGPAAARPGPPVQAGVELASPAPEPELRAEGGAASESEARTAVPVTEDVVPESPPPADPIDGGAVQEAEAAGHDQREAETPPPSPALGPAATGPDPAEREQEGEEPETPEPEDDEGEEWDQDIEEDPEPPGPEYGPEERDQDIEEDLEPPGPEDPAAALRPRDESASSGSDGEDTATEPPGPGVSPEELWAAICAHLPQDDEGLEPFVRDSILQLVVVSLIENALHVAYRDEMPDERRRALDKPEVRELLSGLLRERLGVAEAEVVIKKYIPAVSGEEHQWRRVATAEKRETVGKHPFVRSIRERFGGEIVEIME